MPAALDITGITLCVVKTAATLREIKRGGENIASARIGHMRRGAPSRRYGGSV